MKEMEPMLIQLNRDEYEKVLFALRVMIVQLEEDEEYSEAANYRYIKARFERAWNKEAI